MHINRQLGILLGTFLYRDQFHEGSEAAIDRAGAKARGNRYFYACKTIGCPDTI